MDNTNRDAVEEDEVQNLFYLIDVEKKGVITAQDARLARELIRERFCIDEVGGVFSQPTAPLTSSHTKHFYHQQFQGELASGSIELVKLLFSAFLIVHCCNVACNIYV